MSEKNDEVYIDNILYLYAYIIIYFIIQLLLSRFLSLGLHVLVFVWGFFSQIIVIIFLL